MRGEAPDEFGAFGLGEVDGDGALVAVGGEVIGGVALAAVGPLGEGRAPVAGVVARARSSILMTSAPRSPRIWVAQGPASTRERSRTRTPASAALAVEAVSMDAPAVFGLLSD